MTGDDGSADDLYTPAQAREHFDGFGERDPYAHPFSGIVRDEQTSRYMTMLDTHYDGANASDPESMPGHFSELEHVRNVVAAEATERGREAMRDGDMQTLKHLTGQTDQRADVSGIKAIGKVDQLINGPAPIIVVIGEPGAGKTNFAGLLGQRYVDTHPNALVASNIQSLRETTTWEDERGRQRSGWTAGFPEFKEWLTHEGDPLKFEQTAKLGVLDELSSHAGGSGKSGQLTRKFMGPLVFKVRKFGGALIVIAHDESSIHPLLTRLGVVVKKVSQKKAVVYDRIINGQPRGELFAIEGIPPTDWRYDDKEATEWYWQNEDSESDEGMAEKEVKKVAAWLMVDKRRDGLHNTDIAEFVPYSRETVRRWLKDYDEGGEKADWVAEVEALIE